MATTHAQAEVLRRRLDFLSEPSSYFYDGDRPLGAEAVGDPFRRGILTIARATSHTEMAWIREMLRELTGTA
jgi:hypothetical protein